MVGSKMTGKKIWLAMILILILQILNALYWGDKKEGYYIDELWSYGLSNSYYAPFLQDKEGYMNEWHEPEFYMDYLIVNAKEEFAYDSVYDNQVQDVHPPLYYMILHTVCSLFTGKFSKWFGLIINILFFGGIIWLLYEISGEVLGKENCARLIPPLIYGFSSGALSTIMYIRMYTMLTFWVLLLVMLTFLAVRDYKKSTRLFIGIGMTVTAGLMTQYYFLIFAFFISAVYILWRMYYHRWKEVIEYAVAVLGGVVVELLLFPASVSQILMGQKGKDSISNVFLGFRDFFGRLQQYNKIILKEFLCATVENSVVFTVFAFAGSLLLIVGGGNFKEAAGENKHKVVDDVYCIRRILWSGGKDINRYSGQVSICNISHRSFGNSYSSFLYS